MGNHNKLLQFLRPDPAVAAARSSDDEDEDYASWSPSPMTSTSGATSAAASPSPYVMSPWAQLPGLGADSVGVSDARTRLLGSLVKEDGHVYSLAAAGELLYTGTDSRNVRVWRDRRELVGFRSGSGLVKTIVVAGDGRIYTGHQDGKVRVWRASAEDSAVHRRVGSLPRLRDVVTSSLWPSHYVETRRKHNALWLRHFDAVSCLSLDAAAGLLYSGSWDKTFKVWRLSDSRCLESVRAHDDAINTVAAAGFDAIVFTGSADGTVKVWRREACGKKGRTRHVMERVLRKGESAVTAVAVAAEARVVYVGSSDGAVTHWQWRRGGGEPRKGGALRGHKMAVLCLAVAGRVVVSGSADRTISVWRRKEGADHELLDVLSGHTGPVKCVAMDEEEDADGGDGRRWVVYSGSLDGSVKVWRVPDSSPDPTPARTPAHAWKGAPSPLHSWTPYAVAPEPELKRMTAG
ncbi:protein JINGUBANG-like [Phragmites australis]|uniref:protein JINGUBANG-like n=1 Tax=Phragmites australis TaxID=29695 RepID=UPI002D76BC77|nr:protein JINGUBANG-like [Phragmites australis]